MEGSGSSPEGREHCRDQGEEIQTRQQEQGSWGRVWTASTEQWLERKVPGKRRLVGQGRDFAFTVGELEAVGSLGCQGGAALDVYWGFSVCCVENRLGTRGQGGSQEAVANVRWWLRQGAVEIGEQQRTLARLGRICSWLGCGGEGALSSLQALGSFDTSLSPQALKVATFGFSPALGSPRAPGRLRPVQGRLWAGLSKLQSCHFHSSRQRTPGVKGGCLQGAGRGTASRIAFSWPVWVVCGLFGLLSSFLGQLPPRLASGRNATRGQASSFPEPLSPAHLWILH